MFYQTYAARKPPSACTPVTPSPPAATQWSALLLDDAICSVLRTPYNTLSMGDYAAVSFPFLPLATLTFHL